MRLRLGATAAGVLLIVAAVLGFSLASHPAVAGSNHVQPLYDTVFLHGGVRYCQQVPSLPARTDAVELGVSGTGNGSSALEVVLVGPRGRLARAQADHVDTGRLTLHLDRPIGDH